MFGKNRLGDISRISHHSQVIRPSVTNFTGGYGGMNSQSRVVGADPETTSAKPGVSDETQLDLQALVNGVDGNINRSINEGVPKAEIIDPNQTAEILETNEEMADLGESF